MVGVRSACEARTVNEHVIPIAMVQKVSTVGENIARIQPHAYYAYVKVMEDYGK